MIVQFFRYGSGQSKGPLDYLLGKDRQRAHAKILAGNESEIAGLIDSSPFQKKYTSGCLSFYEDDLSAEAKKKIMSDFEKCLFPGFSQDQYRVLWIEHKDKVNQETGKQRLELNFLIPNTEILTGKRLQPYFHKSDLSRVDLFKKITNFDYRLHDPNDPMNQQAITSKKSLPKATAEIKTVIDIEAEKAIRTGLIHDRTTMKIWLEDLGLEVTRETKKSISIKNPSDDEKARAIRLTGAIYEQDFRLTETSAERTREASQRYRREAEQRNFGDVERYRAHIDEKSRELEVKYRQRAKADYAEAERSNSSEYKADRQRSKNIDAEAERSNSSEYKADRQRSKNIDAEAERSVGRTQSKLGQVQQLERRNSSSDKDKKITFHIEYSLEFTSMYNAYQHYLFGIRQQEQIQRHHRDGEQSPVAKKPRGKLKYSEVWNREKLGLVRPDRPESEAVHQQYANSAGDELDESRSSIIANYRAATDAARESITEIRSTSTSNQRIGDILQEISAIHSDDGREKQRANYSDQEIEESDLLRKFIKRVGDKCTFAVRDTFEKISDWFRDRERSETCDKSNVAELSTERNYDPDKAFSFRIYERERQDQGLSEKSSRFSSEDILKALEQIEERNRKQMNLNRENSSNNDRGYSM